MAIDKPDHANDKDSPSPGGGVSLRPGSSAENPVPSGAESPTLVEGVNAGLIPPNPSPADSPTLLDAPTSYGSGSSGPNPDMRRPMPSQSLPSQLTLTPGMLVTQRYEILEILGEGGMGTVYKANDRELNRQVALKVIRPELAANPDILLRFKQEILLSSKVTHRNVVRIYDLGETQAFKFITMEYVEGKDLRHLLNEKGKLPAEEAVNIIQQVFSGLGAAHREGIIHRDLKPGNIMVDQQGRVVVMDFGLARSIASDGMTRTGLMVGTMEYMSPEQAQAKELDARSDIFTVGLILYELLSGKMPYAADSAVASLLKRTQERAAPVSNHDAAIPRSLSSVVARCLERDPDSRYQNTDEVLADLENWQGKRAAATLRFSDVRPWGRDIPWPMIGVVATVLLLAVTGLLLRNKLFGPGASSTPAPVVSLAILPFHNASGDQSLDWLGPSLADMLSTDVGRSSKLRTVSADRLHQVLKDLHITADAQADPQNLRQLSEFTNSEFMVLGQYTKLGNRVRMDAAITDVKQGRTRTVQEEAASEKDLLPAVDRLAQQIRQSLSLSDDIIKELQSQAFRPSSTSIEALRNYDEGLELVRQGNNLEAQKKFEAATQADPTFALAFSRLAQTYSNLGYDNEAERYSRQAVDLGQQLPAAERYLIQAGNARISNDNQKAIDAYDNLAKASPYDPDIQFALAQTYETASDFDKAREHYAKALEQDPKYVDALLASGRVEIKAGKPEAGLNYLNRAYDLSVQLDNQEAKAAILQAKGVAYRLMDKPQDALRNYQDSMDIKRAIGDQRGIAVSLNEMATAQVMLGKPDDADASYNQALKIRRDIGDKQGIGDTLIDLANLYEDRGKLDKALDLYKESLQIQRDLQDESNQALCLNNIGTAYLSKGQYQDALTYYQQALTLRQKLNVPDDLAETVRNVAVANTKLGQYDEALTDYLKALDLWRNSGDVRGMAMSSYDMGTVFSYQGRFGAALKARQDALQGFRDAKDSSNWMAVALTGYGDALAQAGRGDEAKASFEDALAIARQLKNPSAIAQVYYAQGKSASYRGDSRNAKSLYQQSLQSASQAKDAEQILLAQSALASSDLEHSNAPASIATFRKLASDAESRGMKYQSLLCHLGLAEALLMTKALPQARIELERSLTQAERHGLKSIQARAEFLLGEDFRLSGSNSLAKDHYHRAVQLIDEIQKEAGDSRVLQRADFAQISEQSKHWAD
jgi:serine/threonine protein kinase/tetratricopeptide (TPR) repeat protein